MRDFIFDMETGDPDDFLTLALLAGHPEVRLVAVTVTPGTPHQIGVVRYCLAQFGLDIPVGAQNIDHKKARGTPDEHYVTCVSDWHYRTFGNIDPSHDAKVAWEVLLGHYKPGVTLVTGGPLKNLAAMKAVSSAPLGRLTVQGGFAGDNIVLEALRLPKFAGRITCPTFNLNSAPEAALSVLSEHARFEGPVQMVSKNVCHGVVYDKEMHARLQAVTNPHPGLQMVIRGMDAYLARNSDGKKFHDPLAAMCALNPAIGTWADVTPYREKGEWGCRAGGPIKIIVGYDHELFIQTMIGGSTPGFHP